MLAQLQDMAWGPASVVSVLIVAAEPELPRPGSPSRSSAGGSSSPYTGSTPS